MAELAGEHGDLATMVGIVRDQVTEKSGDIGTKAFDAAIRLHGATHHRAESFTAGFQRLLGLGRSDCGAIELCGNLLGFRRFQPHHAHVVHVSNDCGNGATLAVGWLGLPGFGWKVVDHILVDAVVGVEGVEQPDWQLVHVRSIDSACVGRRILRHR
jgi:hypothetical protein